MVEVDLERAQRALEQLGTALEEARNVVRFSSDGTVRIRTEDKVISLPVSWAVAGAVAFLVATVLSTMPAPRIRRRERDEEPLGIG